MSPLFCLFYILNCIVVQIEKYVVENRHQNEIFIGAKVNYGFKIFKC